MKKNIIIKSLLNGVAACLLFALLMTLAKGINFAQTLADPSTVILGLCSAAGSYIGYHFRAAKKEAL